MKKLLKVPFLCLLVLTAALAAPFLWQEMGLLPSFADRHPPEEPPAIQQPPAQPAEPLPVEPAPPVLEDKHLFHHPDRPTKPPYWVLPDLNAPVPEEPKGPVKPEDPFRNALFIGDSRTVGIRKYAGIEGADFFATTGMSVYEMFKDKTDAGGLTDTDLQSLLVQKTYDRIFIMLGINELGYNFDRTVKTYGEAVTTLRVLQPQAYIHVQANLHVSKSKSDSDKLYNNANINALNEALATLADGEKVFFLDVNPAFDDEFGCLQDDLTWDGVHLLSKHYSIWADWLKENTPA